MKTWNDLCARAQLEINEWFPKQCQCLELDYYWYYLESTQEHDGGILIASERPANPAYKIARKVSKGLTVEQNLREFLQIARRLPVLSMKITT